MFMAVAQNTAQSTVQNTAQPNIYNSTYNEQDAVLTPQAPASAPTSSNDVAAPDTKHSLPNSDLDNKSHARYNEHKNENIGSDEDGEGIDQRGTKTKSNRSNKEEQRASGDRPRIQERVGEKESEPREDSSYGRRNKEVSDYELFSDDKNHIIPDESSELYRVKHTLEIIYGVECYVIKESVWSRKNPACAGEGKIYISESIDEYTIQTLIPNETTHVMQQLDFAPFVDFLNGFPDMVNMQSTECEDLFNIVAQHIGIDFLTMDDEQYTRFYTELNAIVYGFEKGNILGNIQFDFDWIKEAFYDFDSYISELSEIHEQFKKANTASRTENPRQNAQKDKKSSDSTPESEKTQNTAKKSNESKKEMPLNLIYRHYMKPCKKKLLRPIKD